LTRKRQQKKHADAKSKNQQETATSTLSDNARGLNVDEVEVVVAAVDVRSIHAGLESQIPLHREDEVR
jgi:hypothetical protein